MTDNEIIKSLECCIDFRCTDCPMNYEGCEERDIEDVINQAIPIFKRQQAEIEHWKEEANIYQNMWGEAVSDLQSFKNETIKEFAEKFKKKVRNIPRYHFAFNLLHVEKDIDDLVKEMTEKENDNER